MNETYEKSIMGNKIFDIIILKLKIESIIFLII